ncbi:addiction module protein [Halomonas sp. M20]|uniref:addiction module protein n=1 Tax=Halomonas sp. M20 TaxID=2763264 RepID=UPI001D09DBCF|nr:addiction module protein [Halomonas sp. M20]
MTIEALDQLRSQIPTLSKSERAALAQELIMSLDGLQDDAIEQAWDDEIMRRIVQVEAGQANFLTRDEFRQKMRSRIGT